MSAHPVFDGTLFDEAEYPGNVRKRPTDKPSVHRVDLGHTGDVVEVFSTPRRTKCEHEWPDSKGHGDVGNCLKCGTSFTRYIHMECL